MKRKLYRRLGLYPWATHTWAEIARRPEKEIGNSRKLTSFGRRLRIRRQLSVLYGNLRASTFAAMEARVQTSTSLRRSHLFHLFEARLGTCLLRTNCFAGFDHIRSVLREKKVTVNDQPQKKVGYLCRPGDIIRFSINSLQLRQQKKTLLGRPPLHMEIDYDLGCAIMLPQSYCIELSTSLLPEKG